MPELEATASGSLELARVDPGSMGACPPMHLSSKVSSTAATHKWLPVVDENCCTGCSQCVDACDHNCLELMWSYAKLSCADACGSEGTCQEACPEGAIRMEWIPTVGNPDHGQWQFREPAPAPPAARTWLQRVFRIG